jgi:putative flippase GtrA
MISARFAKFVVAGGIAAAANVGSRMLFSLWLPYVPAIVLAYCVGMVTAFSLNRLFVFEPGVLTWRVQAFRFLVVNLAAVAQTVAVSLLFAKVILPAMGIQAHAELIAHGIGVIVPIFTSYLGHRHFTFR